MVPTDETAGRLGCHCSGDHEDGADSAGDPSHERVFEPGPEERRGLDWRESVKGPAGCFVALGYRLCEHLNGVDDFWGHLACVRDDKGALRGGGVADTHGNLCMHQREEWQVRPGLPRDDGCYGGRWAQVDGGADPKGRIGSDCVLPVRKGFVGRRDRADTHVACGAHVHSPLFPSGERYEYVQPEADGGAVISNFGGYQFGKLV